MSKSNHILFIVPDGVGIKNYLYSNILEYVKQKATITIWSTLPREAFDDMAALHKIKFNYKQITLQPEHWKTRLYREAATFARLKYNAQLKNNPTILTNWRKPSYSAKVKILFTLAEFIGQRIHKNYNSILKIEEKARRAIPNSWVNFYERELKEIKPDHVFITHQRVASLMPICVAAKNIHIKTMSAIFSWDNLPKARLSVQTNTYLVWSQWMKDEMKDYYPEIPQEHVKLMGSPQFEFYLDKKRIKSREEFAAHHQLDPNKKWLCFSGDDIITSPYDHLFLNDVAESLESMSKNIQLIFRRCPVDFSDRYDRILERYPDLIVSIDPLWNIQSETGWTGYFPKYEDIDMQVNLSYHCEMVINLGSTMALDFAVNNKPCLYLNYNPSNDQNWSTEVIYNFQHFRTMKGLDAVVWINSKKEIVTLVERILIQQESFAPDKDKWMKKIVLHPIDQNSENIANLLL